MTTQTINALEILMIVIYVVARLLVSASVIYFLCLSDITNGWKVFLIALTIIIGLGFNMKYKNPNDQCDKCLFNSQSTAKLTGSYGEEI